VALDEGIELGRAQVLAHHFRDQFREANLRLPAEFGPGLRGIAKQRVHFGRAKIAAIDTHDDLAYKRVASSWNDLRDPSNFVSLGAFPCHLHARFVGRGRDIA